MTDPNQREIIVAILEEVLEEGKYSHLVLGATLEKYQYLSKQQRAFITRVTQGTIERLLQIDAILGQFVKKPKVPKMKPLIRTVLRSSVYQIVFYGWCAGCGGLQRSRPYREKSRTGRTFRFCQWCVAQYFKKQG